MYSVPILIRILVTIFLSLVRACFVRASCIRPELNLTVFEDIKNVGGCVPLKKACADDGMLVLFDEMHRAENLTRKSAHGVIREHSGLWNFPARGGANSDALIGHQPTSYVTLRPASRMEAAPHLQRPVFSACTLPVIITTDWPYNMGEVMAQLMPIADVYFRQKGMIDDVATLVLATPDGLGMTSFQHVLLSPYSRFPVISFHELAARHHPTHGGPGGEGHHRAAWSQEGHHVSCFEQAVLCKLQGFPQGIAPTIGTLLTHIKDRIPTDPLGFTRPEGAPAPPPGSPAPVSVHDDTTLRVVIESRSGATRNIRNLPELVEACEAASRAGFSAGAFTRLSCKVLHTGDTPQLHGTERFLATVGSVRSAHILVAVHGAGAANCFFLENDQGGTALLELRPCRFGTTHCGWPDAYMHVQLTNAGEGIRFFALNVEDPAQCAPSDYEAAALASPANTPMRGGDDMRARDQHISPRPASFVAMLRHIGGLLRNNDAWTAARDGGQLHGYSVPQGLALGPLCMRELDAHLRHATILK